MGIYTEADRDAVKEAIVKLASGERRVRITYADRTVQKAEADLPQLRALLAEIERDLRGGRKIRTHRLYSGSGLR